MTESEARTVLFDILARLSVEAGDCLMLGIDMGRLPLPAYSAAFNREAFREREQKWCKFILDALLDAVGEYGTLIVPSYTYSCGKKGSIFVAEQTPSENGPFTEYFRSRPQAIRSLHPLFSLSAIGAHAQSILSSCGRSAFGSMSPFGRFAEHGTRFVCLGVELRNSITYIHHLEQMYGCPHRYNKAIVTQVIANGVDFGCNWYASVNYRGLGYTSDISRLQTALDEKGLLVSANWSGYPNQLAEIDDVNIMGNFLLAKDSGAFINHRLTFSFEEAAVSHTVKGDRVMLVIETKQN